MDWRVGCNRRVGTANQSPKSCRRRQNDGPAMLLQNPPKGHASPLATFLENAAAAAPRAPQKDERLLGVRLQRELTSQACLGLPITYRRLIALLSLTERPGASPLRTPLEGLMEEDAVAGRPFVAALAVSALGGGLPAPWFFQKAARLGRFAAAAGDAVEAFAFHAKELQRAVSYYRGASVDGRSAGRTLMVRHNQGDAEMLRARDVMTTQVVAVDTGSTVSEVADLLAMHGISAVPVVDGKKVVGIVSEGDLVRRAEIGTTARPRSWWLNLFRDNAALAAEYTREHSTRVVDVMTTEVETVAETTPLSEIAELLQKKRIKRVPVMRSGHIVGIVSRANLVRALAVTTHLGGSAAVSGDCAIRDQIRDSLDHEIWPSAGAVNFTVADGVVSFWGTVQSEQERKASLVLCENVPGVRRVEDHRVLLDFPIVAV
jgi:CBS domain-containing protein